MKRAFLLMILFFSMLGYCRAQSGLFSILSDTTLSGAEKLDSLQLALNNAANDTVRMDAYYNMALYYLEINRDSSVYYDNKSISLAQKLRLKLNEAAALSDKGYALLALGKYPASLESLSEAFQIAENPASEKSALPFLKGPTPHARRLYNLGLINLHMGQLYGATGNMDMEKLRYSKVLSYAQSIQDTFLLSLAYLNLGYSYTYLNQLDSALYFEQQALALQPHLEFFLRTWEGSILYSLGNIYLKKGNLTLARDAYLKSVESYTAHHNLNYLPNTYDALSKLYERLHKPDSSLFYARKLLETARVLRQPLPLAASYRALSDVYSNLNKRDSTLKYLQLYTILNDSLNNAEKKNLLSYQNIGFEQQLKLKSLQEEKIETETRIRTYAMLSGLGVLLIIGLILYRNNRQKRKTNKILETTLSNLKSTQSQLIQSEKMASLGELTAGIAHEIKNPLNFVNNFSEISGELLDEINEELEKNDKDEALAILEDLRRNLEKINHHGKRADSIVKGMLLHSRGTSGDKSLTDINNLLDEYVNLAYHGMRAQNKDFNITIEKDYDESLEKVKVVPQDISRVFLNIINNGCYAANDKKKTAGDDFSPTIKVSTKNLKDKVEIRIADNGNGVPDKIKDKLFQPFFTTKPTGEGTGLGLSLSYDIVVKQHSGDIKIESKEGEGTKFIIHLPH
ncbi:MAG TPA: ATP-binding protein [Ignavibacteriaceae bacterium]|nr:ATP-binding protein [Ignavibacteriaceae bacterium]